MPSRRTAAVHRSPSTKEAQNRTARVLRDPHNPFAYDMPGKVDGTECSGDTLGTAGGGGVVADLVPGVVLEREAEALTAFELAVAARFPLRDIASQLHLLARLP